MHILLTNDDSHDSPLFLIAIELLKQYGELTIVVPAEEQRRGLVARGLYVDKIDLHGTPAYSVTGTPADCVNLALYNLMEAKPDIVVSGVNLGFNTGLGFLLASGTVGACLEANIAGLPGLALSQEISFEDHREWDASRSFGELVHTRLGQTYYGQAFAQRGDQYHHRLARFEIDQDADTDLVVVRQGLISAAHIDVSILGQQIRD